MRNAMVILLALFLGLATGPSPIGAQDRPSFWASADVVSQYLWRGYALSEDSLVIQPAMGVGFRGFEMVFWGNYDTDRPGHQGADWTETDLTLSWSREVGDRLSVSLGSIYYALDGVEDSAEVYGGFSLDLDLLSISLTVYREVAHYPGWWFQLGLSREFFLPKGMTIDLAAQAIYLSSEDEEAYPDPDDSGEAFDGPLSGSVSVTLTVPLGEHLRASGLLAYSFPLGDDAKDHLKALSVDRAAEHLYGGVRLEVSY